MTRLIRTGLRGLLAGGLAAMPGLAEAHTGVHPFSANGGAAGFAHPMLGADHLLAMVAVGLWAASLGGRARWLVPASFVALMALGAALGGFGPALPAVEPMIALSVIALGVLIALAVRVPTAAAAAMVALFGLFHGAAHGAEMPAMASPLAYVAGFVAATLILHGVGLALGAVLPRTRALKFAGGAIAAAGLALAFPL
ncbi:HupE/UreJ family protein [Rhodopseudomonas sp. HC1]|uniref:HupE/UreJ family protein n=1 Tax=Rhodopseudomonas infernalis TaxID=2897386 RepID=UPI001EE861DE|nr:HupE/UreJ family protein [Rhodopseudomonas infernalis]MCG6207420.1 HupE/UreJ family protein [Rhodopseudomonas infernalis]